MTNKIQRIRDPLHDLIEFSFKGDLERTLWEVMATPQFQWLRRVKQLGFSDLVFPGACHSRFAHSVGVFHLARKLMKVIENKSGKRDQAIEKQALAAALVHDIGHGPFSHAFENVGRKLDLKIAGHELVSAAIIRDSPISDKFSALGSGFANDVADILCQMLKCHVLPK
jgi:HD superfamily phosphohydrolase